MSQPDLAAIDEEWGTQEATVPAKAVGAKAPSVRRSRAAAAPRTAPSRPEARAIPRPAERLRGLALPILSREHAAPIPMRPPSVDTEAPDPKPAIARLAIAAIARETTSLAGVPTLKELLVARAEAREREELERRDAGSFPPNRYVREAPVLFPVQRVPTVVNDADREASRALFAYGTLVGAIAVGLSVLVALLLR